MNNGLRIQYIAFQSYDYASSMSGRINGTQQKLSDLTSHTIPFISCEVHRLNTFLKHSCDTSVLVGDLYSTLEHLYFLFSASTKDIDNHSKTKLSTLENSLQLRNLSNTRWIVLAE